MMLQPTLTLDEAARGEWDVVVVGAGPAGALAARELARWGLAILLVDKAAFPRWKVCGCCLNGRALAVLRAVGLMDLPHRLGAKPLHRFLLAGRGRRASLPIAGGAALSRAALDAGLIAEGIAAGVAFLPQTQVVLDAVEAETRCVLLHQSTHSARLSARLILAADGLGGRLLAGANGVDVALERGSWIGGGVVLREAAPAYGPGTIFMACGSGGYVGLVRLEDGGLNVAAAFDPNLVKRLHHPGAAATAILQEAGFPPLPKLDSMPWRGTPPLTRRATRLARPRLFILGDAAGYVQPFTGEGIAWALAAAQAVTALAVRAVARWQPSLEEEWAALHRRTVASGQTACRVLMRGLRHPLLTTAAIATLARFPTLAYPILSRVGQTSIHSQGTRS